MAETNVNNTFERIASLLVQGEQINEANLASFGIGELNNNSERLLLLLGVAIQNLPAKVIPNVSTFSELPDGYRGLAIVADDPATADNSNVYLIDDGLQVPLINADKCTDANIRSLPERLVKAQKTFWMQDDGMEGFWRYNPNLNDSNCSDNTGIYRKTVWGGYMERVIETAISPEWFGAKGDGIQDDTNAITACFTQAVGNRIILKGTYCISRDITLQNNVKLVGANSRSTVKSINSTNYIKVVGTDYNLSYIAHLTLDRVGIKYGDTINDFARGPIINNVKIKNAEHGIVYKNNSWLCKIINSEIRNCTKGVFFEFDNAINSGACIVLSNTNIYNCQDGIFINKICLDGFDIKLSNCNVEHNDYSIRTNEAFGGCLFIENGHYELNNVGFIKNDGCDIFVKHVWMFDNPNSQNYEAHFVNISGNIKIESSRISYQDYKLAKIIGGDIYICNKTCITVGLSESHNPNSLDSHKGINFENIRVFRNIQIPTGSTYTLEEIPPFDCNYRKIEANIEVNTSSTTTAVEIYMNPSGQYGHSFTFSSPIKFYVISLSIIESEAYIEIKGIDLNDNIIQKNAIIMSSNSISVRRFVDIRFLGASIFTIKHASVKIN